jgi:hypothetical protein
MQCDQGIFGWLAFEGKPLTSDDAVRDAPEAVESASGGTANISSTITPCQESCLEGEAAQVAHTRWPGARHGLLTGRMAAWNVCLESADTSCGPPTPRL